MNKIELEIIDDAIGHLGSAISQSIPSDDQIIVDHIKAAHTVLKMSKKIESETPDLLEDLEDLARMAKLDGLISHNDHVFDVISKAKGES